MVTEAKEIMRSIQAVDETIAQQTQAQKHQSEQQARIRAHVRAVAHGKDVVIPASKEEDGPTPTKKAGLKLPTPKKAGSSQDPFGGGRGRSIQAIVGEVLILQAKDQSQFWSTLWKQASEAQKAFITFAPIIASNTKANWDAQAAVTQNESDMAFQDGLSDAITAGLTIGIGAFSDGEDGAGAGADGAESAGNITEDAADGLEDGLDDGSTQGVSPATSEASTAEKGLNEANDAGKATTKEGEKLEDAASKGADGSGQFGKVGKFFSAMKRSISKKGIANTMQKGLQNSMAANIASNAGKGLFVDSKYKSLNADNQKDAGKADATAKMSEQYAQYWTQLFSRQEDLRGAAQQNLDYVMNILKSVSDTTTQTVTSMFRG